MPDSLLLEARTWTWTTPSGVVYQHTPPPPPAHPSAHESVLESANPRVECAPGRPWSTARAPAPSPGRPTPGVVKQDKSSRGSVDTTKTRSGPQRVRMSSGERPIGKQSDTEALCHPPPPPRPLVSNECLVQRTCRF